MVAFNISEHKYFYWKDENLSRILLGFSLN